MHSCARYKGEASTSCCRRRSSASAASGACGAADPTTWKAPLRPAPASTADREPCSGRISSARRERPSLQSIQSARQLLNLRASDSCQKEWGRRVLRSPNRLLLLEASVLRLGSHRCAHDLPEAAANAGLHGSQGSSVNALTVKVTCHDTFSSCQMTSAYTPFTEN